MMVSPIARSESSFKVKRSEFIGILEPISKTEHVNENLKIRLFYVEDVEDANKNKVNEIKCYNTQNTI